MNELKKGFAVPILVAVAALLLVGGFYVYSSKNKVGKTSSSNIAACENIKHVNVYGQDDSEKSRAVCYENMAIQNKDISLCDKIPDHLATQNTCRYFVSVKIGDLALCDKLPDERGNFTKYGCYSAIGAHNHDYAICNLIPQRETGDGDAHNGCVTQVARYKGDCDTLDPVGRDYCYMYQSQSVRVSARDGRCDVYSQPSLKNLCEQYQAGQMTVQKDCARISDAKLVQECLDQNINTIHVNYTK